MLTKSSPGIDCTHVVLSVPTDAKQAASSTAMRGRRGCRPDRGRAGTAPTPSGRRRDARRRRPSRTRAAPAPGSWKSSPGPRTAAPLGRMESLGDALGPHKEAGLGEDVPLPQQRLGRGGRAGVDHPHRALLGKGRNPLLPVGKSCRQFRPENDHPERCFITWSPVFRAVAGRVGGVSGNLHLCEHTQSGVSSRRSQASGPGRRLRMRLRQAGVRSVLAGARRYRTAGLEQRAGEQLRRVDAGPVIGVHVVD